MKGLRLSELYSSIQGEGPRMGVVTTFVRFGGCNMRCPGWPCDTPHAIFPEIWKRDPLVEPEYILKEVENMPGKNVCITGGEPTMQPLEALENLCTDFLLRDYTIDVFTNGSLHPLPLWMLMERDVSVILDWKLAGSGEQQHGVDTRLTNVRTLTDKDAIKFVVAEDMDFDEAMYIWDMIKDETGAAFWVGVAWGKYQESTLIDRVKMSNLPWRVNIQVHKYIWPGVEKGI